MKKIQHKYFFKNKTIIQHILFSDIHTCLLDEKIFFFNSENSHELQQHIHTCLLDEKNFFLILRIHMSSKLLFYRRTFLLVYIAPEPSLPGWHLLQSCFKQMSEWPDHVCITYAQCTWAKLSSYFQLFSHEWNKSCRPCIRPGAIGKSNG